MVIKGLKWLLFEENWRPKLDTAEKRDRRNRSGRMEVAKIMRALRGHVGSAVPFPQKVKGIKLKQ